MKCLKGIIHIVICLVVLKSISRLNSRSKNKIIIKKMKKNLYFFDVNSKKYLLLNDSNVLDYIIICISLTIVQKLSYCTYYAQI